jgi:hypothetical protein
VTEENQCTWRKSCPSATFFTTNPTWNDLGFNPGFCSETQVTKHLSCGTAFSFHILGYITLQMITLITCIFTGCCHWRESEKIWRPAKSESVARLYKGFKRQAQLLSHAAATSCSVPRSLSGNDGDTLLYFSQARLLLSLQTCFRLVCAQK